MDAISRDETSWIPLLNTLSRLGSMGCSRPKQVCVSWNVASAVFTFL